MSTPLHVSGSEPPRGSSRLRAVAIVLVSTAAVSALTACSQVSTAPDKVALHYKAGPLSSTEFENCVNPSTREVNGPGDLYYSYPVNQRTFDASDAPGADSKPITIVSKDNVEMSVPVSITLTLVSDCDTLRTFHERLGNRYAAYFTDDDTTGPEGWGRLLNFGVGKPVDTNLDRAAQQFEWRKLWNDPATKTAIEKQLEESLEQSIDQQTGGHFFEVNNVLIQKPTPTNAVLVQNVAAEQASVAKARSAEAEANAQKAAAEAQVAVARAEAAKIQERIKVLGRDGYLRELEIEAQQAAIAKGLNPYPPTIVPGAGVGQ